MQNTSIQQQQQQLPQNSNNIFSSSSSSNTKENVSNLTKSSLSSSQHNLFTTKLPSNQYQSTECILYGSISNNDKGQFIERLKGLCDPGGPIPFFEHNMVFKLKTSTDSSVQVQMRRRFKTDNLHWHCRYIASPETAVKDVIVRKVIDSLIYSNDMMLFVKSLGLRFESLKIFLAVVLVKCVSVCFGCVDVLGSKPFRIIKFL